MKTWITKLKAVWGLRPPGAAPALLLAAGGAFWLAYANPSGAFSMLAMLGAACLVFLTQLPRAAKYGWCALVLCVLLPLVGDAVVLFHGRGDAGRHVCRAGAGG